ncbi:MAG TPA: hypothetical protein VMV81_14505, partial [Phycisphaerae bacterium]|nr:hypothetical protein [Phycisphaerae bacterium]
MDVVGVYYAIGWHSVGSRQRYFARYQAHDASYFRNSDVAPTCKRIAARDYHDRSKTGFAIQLSPPNITASQVAEPSS